MSTEGNWSQGARELAPSRIRILIHFHREAPNLREVIRSAVADV